MKLFKVNVWPRTFFIVADTMVQAVQEAEKIRNGELRVEWGEKYAPASASTAEFVAAEKYGSLVVMKGGAR